MGKMYRRWDKFEVQDVIARYLSGEDVQAIAEEYGRSVRSIDMPRVRDAAGAMR